MIGHQGPRPGRTPSQADTASSRGLDSEVAPDARASEPGTEPAVPFDAASRADRERPRREPEPAGNPGSESEHKGVDLARLAWLGTVGACLIAVAILVVQGYYGYAAVTCAVAASAALNLT